jgi:hypothetical protein
VPLWSLTSATYLSLSQTQRQNVRYPIAIGEKRKWCRRPISIENDPTATKPFQEAFSKTPATN